MGRKIDSIEREIDRIRLEIYEETKHMTREEQREYYRKSSEATAKKYGIKIYSNIEEYEMSVHPTARDAEK
jgi:hypothetical protein